MKTARIAQVEYGLINIPFTHPIKTPIGDLDGAKNLAIKITTDDGLVGWGEASPMLPITGDSQESNYKHAAVLAQLLLGENARSIAQLNDTIIAKAHTEPSLRSAFDMALYDLAAQSVGMPLYQFLGGQNRPLVTNYTIGNQETVKVTCALVQARIDEGFTALKLKVGRPGLTDLPHVEAVRNLVGPDVSIKIDSNQGWNLDEAHQAITAMKAFDVVYAEQPLHAQDIKGMAALRKRISIPVCADESVFDHHDAQCVIHHQAADYINIKLGKSGGIHNGLKINSVAESAHVQCMVGCFGESRLGLTAAAHLAVARPNIRFIDLDSAYHLKTDPVKGGMTYVDGGAGKITLSEQPGLGASFDESQIEQMNQVS